MCCCVVVCFGQPKTHAADAPLKTNKTQTKKVVEAVSEDGLRFYVPYDALALCTGSQGSTFGIKGVEQHAHFLRDVKNAEAIRSRLIGNIALANVPGVCFCYCCFLVEFRVLGVCVCGSARSLSFSLKHPPLNQTTNKTKQQTKQNKTKQNK